MSQNSPNYPTKAAWAAATAARLRDQAAQARSERHAAANWRAVRSKMHRLDTLHREATRWERMAARFRTLGV